MTLLPCLTRITPNAAPTASVLLNNSLTRFGGASVATSQSFGSNPSSKSLTHPPAKYASCPLARNRRTTASASARSHRGLLGRSSIWGLSHRLLQQRSGGGGEINHRLRMSLQNRPRQPPVKSPPPRPPHRPGPP